MAKKNPLGHIFHKDSRDGLFTMGQGLMSVTVVPEWNIWERGESTNQGREGACVGFGWGNWHNCKPKGFFNQVDSAYCFGYYHRAQELDPFPGTDYDGTTLRAGAKVAQERNLLDVYVWARSILELDAWVLSKGPLVVASNWYHSMDNITASDFTPVNINSGVRGGHCYLIYGLKDGVYHCQNSWGDFYGDGGSFYLTKEGLTKLWNFGQLEAVTALQEGVA